MIRRGRLVLDPGREPEPSFPRYEIRERDLLIEYGGIATFAVRDGRRVTVDPVEGTEPSLVRLYLTGPVLAAALHQRGLLVLHGSTIGFEGSAAGFLGGQGWGKSTTAAMMHQRGHALLTDDVMAIEVGCDPPLVRPGFPQLKLWPDALSKVGPDPASLPRLVAGLDKRAHRLQGDFESSATPIRRLYILADGAVPAIEPLSPRESAFELIRHSYFAERLAIFRGFENNLRLCAELAAKASVRRLRRPRALGELDRLASMIERDLSAGAAASA